MNHTDVRDSVFPQHFILKRTRISLPSVRQLLVEITFVRHGVKSRIEIGVLNLDGALVRLTRLTRLTSSDNGRVPQ